jgi:hypothetical protein
VKLIGGDGDLEPGGVRNWTGPTLGGRGGWGLGRGRACVQVVYPRSHALTALVSS